MGTRDRMLDAAAHVMRTRGLARATTKEIAREAGFSEAALYKHFRDKTELFTAVLSERVPGGFPRLLAGLPGRVGREPVEDVLLGVARQAVDFYRQTLPMAASLFAEPSLLAAHRASLEERDAGPHKPRELLAAYLAAERERGNLRSDADPAAAASLLLGACLQQVFVGSFADQGDDEDFVADTVRTLVDGIGGGQR